MSPFALGFSLIELLITLAIIGILTALSLPLYSHYRIQEERIEAESALVQMASALEEYFIAENTYEGATLRSLNVPNTAANKAYQLVIASASESSYQLAAIPVRPDELCGTLILNETGERGTTGTGKITDCW